MYRSPEYYSRPVKGTWAGEGGGALMTQGIHQVDLLLALAGPVKQVFGFRQLGALHRIESEDVVNAVFEYASGATGVIQAATAFWPGMPERIEIHGTRGTAIITGDQLTAWNMQDDRGDPPTLVSETHRAPPIRWRFRRCRSSASFSTSEKLSEPAANRWSLAKRAIAHWSWLPASMRAVRVESA